MPVTGNRYESTKGVDMEHGEDVAELITAAMATPAAFTAWLTAAPISHSTGISRSTVFCPIACWVNYDVLSSDDGTFDGWEVLVLTEVVELYYKGQVQWVLPLPKWTREFISRVDNTGNEDGVYAVHKIPPEIALEILNAIEE